jgi:predicted dehydrogenase
MRVGVIGCGAVAIRAHLPAYRSIGAEIVGVADVDESRARFSARKFNVAKWFCDYRELLREDIDVVSVCTPNATHSPITIDAAKAGKHVLVEKPMATTLEDADRMIEACKDSGVKLCPIFNYRFLPSVQEAKKRVEAGRIGRVLAIHGIAHVLIPMVWSKSEWFYYKWGLLEDFGVHLIDVINYVLSPSKVKDGWVAARDLTESMACLNQIDTLILLDNGACIHLDLSWITGCYELSLKVLGSAGTFDLDLRDNYLREIHGFSTPLEDMSSSFQKSLRVVGDVLRGVYFEGALKYHRLVIRQFVESIEKKSKPPISVEEGRSVIAIMDFIKRRYS